MLPAMNTRVGKLWPLALFALSPACDSGGGESPGDSPLPPLEQNPDFMTDRDLATVCEGKAGPKGTAPYAKKAGQTSPVLVYFRDKPDGEFASKSTTTFSPWRADKTKDTQLVACVTVKSEKKARECKFDKEKPAKWVDQLDASYSISVREASTGKEVAKQDVDVKAPSTCPTLFFFDSQREKDYARFEPTLLAMMGPLQPPDAPKPDIREGDLAGACEGKPILGASKYEKKSGAISPVAAFRREGDGGWTEGIHPGQSFKDHEWWTSDAEKYQLVVCMTTKRGEKVKDCEFDGGSKVALIDASYTIAIHEATTGKKLEEKRFEGKSNPRCPFLWNFRDGQENVFVADPGDAAKNWLASFAAPG